MTTCQPTFVSEVMEIGYLPALEAGQSHDSEPRLTEDAGQSCGAILATATEVAPAALVALPSAAVTLCHVQKVRGRGEQAHNGQEACETSALHLLTIWHESPPICARDFYFFLSSVLTPRRAPGEVQVSSANVSLFPGPYFVQARTRRKDCLHP